MKIYTKTGDKGETGIIGKRLPKDSKIFEVLGTLDELNAVVGVTIAKMAENEVFIDNALISRLQTFQNTLFSIGALIAGGKSELDLVKLTTDLEWDIDGWDKELTALTNFILPGGTLVAANIHNARAICRRCERAFITFRHELDMRNEKLVIDDELKEVGKYLNRLSDWLFTMARYVNLKLGVEDVIWKK
jgi:cob(I)alamin adenosyltransferase